MPRLLTPPFGLHQRQVTVQIGGMEKKFSNGDSRTKCRSPLKPTTRWDAPCYGFKDTKCVFINFQPAYFMIYLQMPIYIGSLHISLYDIMLNIVQYLWYIAYKMFRVFNLLVNVYQYTDMFY